MSARVLGHTQNNHICMSPYEASLICRPLVMDKEGGNAMAMRPITGLEARILSAKSSEIFQDWRSRSGCMRYQFGVDAFYD